MNKNQKRILYRNMGILFALTAACAILVRCTDFSGGETLEDIAKRQEVSSSEEAEISKTPVPEDSETTETFPSEKAKKPEITASEKTEITETPLPEGVQELPENESEHSPEEKAMEDRTIYQEGFYYESLSDTVKEKITGISYPADDSNAAISYDTLRYVRVQYYDFNGESQSGELVCHKAVAQDMVEIFYELYEAHYPIEKINLVDDYQGDDNLSMQDNNTSCFNYRALPSGKLSNHAYGLAIDLNPFYNPYVITSKDGTVHITPSGSEIYADREQEFAYKIDKEDLAYQLFIDHGFTWGGSWRSSKDYQHFEKAI